MKHLFVTNDFPPKMGGIESYLTNLCLGFDPADIAVIAPVREGYEEVDAALPYEVVRLPGSYLKGGANVMKALIENAARLDVDAVHFLAALPLGRIGSKIREELKIPFTVVAHGTGEILLPSRVPLARQALKGVLTSADVVFPVSEFTRAAVDKLTKGRAHTALLPPTVDIARYSLAVSGGAIRTEYALGSRFVVLFISRLVKRKGADILLRAISATQETFAIIGGDGPERASLERLATELEISDRVVFTGLIPDDRMAEYYAAADLFCMPCTNRYGGLDTEGFGVVYIEAAATGLPVIAGAAGGSVEAVEDGVTGVVLTDPAPRTVAIELAKFKKDPALCAKFGGAGRARVERSFAPVVAAKRLEDAMADVSVRAN